MGLAVQIIYLPWTFPWWTILSVDDAGRTRHLRDDCLLTNHILHLRRGVAAVSEEVFHLNVE